jgi:hypothetical protein
VVARLGTVAFNAARASSEITSPMVFFSRRARALAALRTSFAMSKVIRIFLTILHYAINIKLLFKNQNPSIGSAFKPFQIVTARQYSFYEVIPSSSCEEYAFAAALRRSRFLTQKAGFENDIWGRKKKRPDIRPLLIY